GQQVGVMGTVPTLHPGAKTTWKRRLVIGNDLGEVMGEIARVKGRGTGTFDGVVTDTVGSPIADALITVTATGVDLNDDGTDDIVARARSAADGSFATKLPPGN